MRHHQCALRDVILCGSGGMASKNGHLTVQGIVGNDAARKPCQCRVHLERRHFCDAGVCCEACQQRRARSYIHGTPICWQRCGRLGNGSRVEFVALRVVQHVSMAVPHDGTRCPSDLALAAVDAVLFRKELCCECGVLQSPWSSHLGSKLGCSRPPSPLWKPATCTPSLPPRVSHDALCARCLPALGIFLLCRRPRDKKEFTNALRHEPLGDEQQPLAPRCAVAAFVASPRRAAACCSRRGRFLDGHRLFGHDRCQQQAAAAAASSGQPRIGQQQLRQWAENAQLLCWR